MLIKLWVCLRQGTWVILWEEYPIKWKMLWKLLQGQSTHIPIYKCQLHFINQYHFLKKDSAVLQFGPAHFMLGNLLKWTFQSYLNPVWSKWERGVIEFMKLRIYASVSPDNDFHPSSSSLWDLGIVPKLSEHWCLPICNQPCQPS